MTKPRQAALRFCSDCSEILEQRQQSYCRSCLAKRQREWRKNNFERYQAISKKSSRILHLRKTYNLTPEEFTAMLVAQNNCCKICKKTFHRGKVNIRISIDHDHATGRVRGLLCQSCNIGVSHLEKDENWLPAALAYLRGGNASTA